MKVLVAAVSYVATISGVQRHALNVARSLLCLPEISEVHFVVAPWQGALTQYSGLPADPRFRTRVAEMKRDSFSRNLWYWRDLPRLATQLEVDLVHLTYPMPINSRAFTCPTVVTLHDLYPYEIPANFGFPRFIFNRVVLRQCLQAADAIASISDSTRFLLRQYATPVVSRKATTIYACPDSIVDSISDSIFDTSPGANPETSVVAGTDFDPLASNASPIPGWNNEPFLLCVAQHRPNKNLCTMIRAFDRLIASGWIHPKTKLVIVGTRSTDTPRIFRLVRDKGIGSRIHFLEGLSVSQLHWCYRNCEALVAPSLTEGFDLPIAEAMLAGCRIVCSSIPAHREIAGGKCTFVTLRENPVEALAAAIADALDEPKPHPIVLPQFSAPVLASQYLALYRRVTESFAPQNSAKSAASITPAKPEPTDLATPDPDSALAYRGR
jgi:glycosyltransferase involved in cell wall biosynthesis